MGLRTPLLSFIHEASMKVVTSKKRTQILAQVYPVTNTAAPNITYPRAQRVQPIMSNAHTEVEAPKTEPSISSSAPSWETTSFVPVEQILRHLTYTEYSLTAWAASDGGKRPFVLRAFGYSVETFLLYVVSDLETLSFHLSFPSSSGTD